VNVLEAHAAAVELRGRRILHDVSLRFEAGALTAVVGPNGAGKSTFLRAIAGLQRLSAGKIMLNGRDLWSIERRNLARQLSFVPQSTHFPFEFTVREVVATGRNPHRGRFKREQDADRASIEEALALTDTASLANRMVTELSGGERQRVLIARSLATRAGVILLDEPTANLDPSHALDVLELCRSLADAGTVVILTTQDLSMVVRYADRVALMKTGNLVTAGSREVLTEDVLRSVFGVRTAWALTPEGDSALVFHRAYRLPETLE
jgi:iron complex transport system ATP-binding protein